MDIQTIKTYSRRIIEDPRRLLEMINSPCARGILLHSWREPSAFTFLNNIIPIERKDIDAYLHEIQSNNAVHSFMQKRYLEVRGRPLLHPQGWAELLYVLIRKIKPALIVETGVFDGVSSSYILSALDNNNSGKLISVDLPATHVIPGSTDYMPFHTLPKKMDPGWLVPDFLRNRWQLNIIKSNHDLKNILEPITSIDFFLHDSLHIKVHMTWEMELAYKKLKKNGLLLVDDIYCNDAFCTFTKKQKEIPAIKYGFGVLKK